MATPTILSELDKVENLPTLPVIVQQIQKLIASPNSSMSQIATIITKDQAIAARIIRLINSAFYGMSGRVTSIQQSITLLGLNTVKNLVAGVSIVKMFDESPGSVSLFDRNKFWMHSFACAMGARMIAKELHDERAEDFFLAGLLHDIGILVLDQFFHDRFIATLQHSVTNRVDYIKAESDILGITHEEVGEFVANKWKIPEVLIHTIRHHHNPVPIDRACEGSLDAISTIHIADVFTMNRGIDPISRTTIKQLNDTAVRRINIPVSRLEEIFDVVEKDVKTVMTEWGL